MDNGPFLEELKFGIGDGNLNYYLYNWKCPTIDPMKVSIVVCILVSCSILCDCLYMCSVLFFAIVCILVSCAILCDCLYISVLCYSLQLFVY